jgi:hydrogenase/urease accessory protein HupE
MNCIQPRGKLLACVLFLASWAPGPALAHDATFSRYSKYEATTSGREIAFVYALEKKSTIEELVALGADPQLDEESAHTQAEVFGKYFFERVRVSNNGKACTHPPKLFHFGWDESTSRMLAVTKFQCDDELDNLTIASTVTHDMQYSHATMGDLAHGVALVRHAFVDDDLEAQHKLSEISQTQRATPKRRAPRGRVSYVAVPDTKRRYAAWTEKVLGHQVQRAPEPDSTPFFETFFTFIGEGIKHIFLGLDHILFIVTLVLTVRTWKQLGMIVTSFTVAHSLTLAGATFGLISLATPVVEPAIALSVLFVAMDALLRPAAVARPAVTFGFGLLHGFGLSGVLLDLGLRETELTSALLGFNVGVEAGQLAIVAPIFPLVIRLQRRDAFYLRVRKVSCSAVALMALVWIVLRVREAMGA